MKKTYISYCYDFMARFRHSVFLILLVLAPTAQAATYTFVVQPILPPDRTIKAFAPLTNYLTKKTGHTFKLVTSLNFLSYWQNMKKGGKYDFILDAAHLTDYRIKRMNYKVLAKRADAVSYSLVSNENSAVLDPEELIGKSLATIGSPSLGMLRLEEMFPNPLRQPVIVEVDNSLDSIKKVLNGKVQAAIVPTPLVSGFPELLTIITTEQVPHIAISAAPNVPADLQSIVQKLLLNAGNNPEGQKMLADINFSSFETTTASAYEGYSTVLENVWGY